ncbi:S41 family peptidase [Empedobacter falsenii]
MKKLLILICIIQSSIIVQAQRFQNDSVKTFIDQSLDIIENNAVNVENITSIKKRLYEESVDFKSVDEVAPLFEDVFKNLHDYHGGLKYKSKSFGWNKTMVNTNTYLKSKIKNETKVESLVLKNSIGYIRIPGNDDFSFKKVDSISNDIVLKINAIDSEKIKGWIIDLRLNTGGNMYPILLGLKEFIGNNLIFGGFINSKNEITGNWEIKNNNLLERVSELIFPDKKTIPIAILTSGYTASAGEMTTISFIGRENTYIIGEPTANYTTAVQGFKINKDAAINLSTDYVIDRNRTIYKASIQPNYEIIEGDNFENLSKDLKIIKALQTLKYSCTNIEKK